MMFVVFKFVQPFWRYGAWHADRQTYIGVLMYRMSNGTPLYLPFLRHVVIDKKSCIIPNLGCALPNLDICFFLYTRYDKKIKNEIPIFFSTSMYKEDKKSNYFGFPIKNNFVFFLNIRSVSTWWLQKTNAVCFFTGNPNAIILISRLWKKVNAFYFLIFRSYLVYWNANSNFGFGPF